MKTLFTLALAAFMAAGVALAHSKLYRSNPDEHSQVKAPQQVLLEFGEAIEIRFSTFKVYRLEASPKTLANPKLLEPLAQQLTGQVLQVRGDEAKRADSGLTTAGNTVRLVTLHLKPNLDPGAYVVMWQVLSVDTHVLKDFYVFVVQP